MNDPRVRVIRWKLRKYLESGLMVIYCVSLILEQSRIHRQLGIAYRVVDIEFPHDLLPQGDRLEHQ